MQALHPYFRANTLLNGVFFDGRFAGQPVYLSLDNEMRSTLARELDCSPDEVEDSICASVKSYLGPGNDPYSRLEMDMRGWRRGGMRAPPPCTAMLFCLAHAAAIMAADGEFASNNYYRRLSQLTGLPRDVLSGSRVATEMFWDGLSDWLLLNNHALGKPTARATNAWRYVGKAMSQAIVRASDRPHFHDLFEKFGFSGSEAVAPRDMEHYLSHWMETSGPTPRLKRVWRDPTLRERGAEAAIAELHDWSLREGSSGNGATARPIRLSLLANLVPSFPRPLLELHLGRLGEVGQRGPFSMQGTSSAFFLANDLIGGVATLSPNPFGKGGSQMSSALQFNGTAAGNEPGMAWEPRLIIPLAMHPQANAWMEVARVAFAVPHLLLVRNANNLPQQVDRYLAAACATLPAKASDDLDGLPPGWVLYQDVQVRQLIEPSRKELECLVPLGDEGTLAIEGGLQLLPGFFHTKMPPKAIFLAGNGPTHVKAIAIGNGDVVIGGTESEKSECSLDLQGLVNGSGGVVVRGWHGNDDPVARDLFFRNADQPHPLNQDGRGRLAYVSLLSASQPVAGAQAFVEGCTAVGNPHPGAPPSLPMSVGSVPEGALEDSQVATLAAPLAAHASGRTCIERGYHVTVFPMVRPNTPAGKPFEGTCSDCKRSEVIIYRARPQDAKDQTPTPLRVQLPSIKVQASLSGRPVDPDTLLDALCFIGHGSWGRFQSLVESWGDGGKHPRQVAHELFLLGHLDLELRPGSNSVKAWCVPPPSVNCAAGGRAFLAGFRSPSLLGALERAAKEAGGRLLTEGMQGLPTHVWLEGISDEATRKALVGLRDPLGRPVTVNDQAGIRLAQGCESLKGINAFLRPISIGRVRNLQRFDLSSTRWSDVQFALGEGAYRWNDGLQVYAYMGADGGAVAGPYQVVKLLAARSAGIQLHHYDQGSSTFLSTLGCEPPGLLERTLVACSGELPLLGRGIASYNGVPPSVAATILATLYPKDSIEHEERKSSQCH